METITGVVERITFQNEESGFTVLQLKVTGFKDLVCVVGSCPAVQPGETLSCSGVWKQHLVHGRQFDLTSYQLRAPSDLIGIKKYLGSGLIKGIGPKYAERIVKKFGLSTLDIFEHASHRLNEVEGIGPKRISQIQKCWLDQKVIRDVMIFLQGHGVSPAYSQKLFKNYGQSCIEKVQTNPYQMARDIHGIGFKTADTIAEKLGILKDAPIRIEAGVEYVLRELSDEGHVCYPEELLIPTASEILNVSKELVINSLSKLQHEERIERFPLIKNGQKEPFVWFKPLFIAEVGIAKEIQRIVQGHSPLRTIDLNKAVAWVQEKLKITLAQAQCEAVMAGLSKKFLIITGGPGTGKSTITNAILKISSELTSRMMLAAPTGRAAKRLSEITGKEAKTIHALLEVDFKNGGFKRKRENPLECDLLIIDESSMIDTHLMYSLLKAIPTHARVIFVGDVNQLPSVGPGNVLLDLIFSMQLPVVTLKEIFRQAQGSAIIVNSHKINEGIFPDLSNRTGSDFFFVEAENPEDVLKHIVQLVVQRLPAKFNFKAKQEIQVLAPMKRGIIGTENLNIVLQEHLNPQTNQLLKFGHKWQIGDKVMQIRNNYQKLVYNGDIGTILHIDYDEQEILIQFDDLEIPYEFSELDELQLAYAVSIHKYQGSECPCVVIPIHTTHFKLLHRNLLYTGVTRGKKLVVLVGTKKAIAIAVKNQEVKERHTGLKNAILGILS